MTNWKPAPGDRVTVDRKSPRPLSGTVDMFCEDQHCALIRFDGTERAQLGGMDWIALGRLSPYEELVPVPRAALEALRQAVDEMHDFARSCQEDIDAGRYQRYDEVMTDWREDIANRAESLIAALEA